MFVTQVITKQLCGNTCVCGCCDLYFLCFFTYFTCICVSIRVSVQDLLVTAVLEAVQTENSTTVVKKRKIGEAVQWRRVTAGTTEMMIQEACVLTDDAALCCSRSWIRFNIFFSGIHFFVPTPTLCQECT